MHIYSCGGIWTYKGSTELLRCGATNSFPLYQRHLATVEMKLHVSVHIQAGHFAASARDDIDEK